MEETVAVRPLQRPAHSASEPLADSSAGRHKAFAMCDTELQLLVTPTVCGSCQSSSAFNAATWNRHLEEILTLNVEDLDLEFRRARVVSKGGAVEYVH
ncbi:hypothetical protein [Microbispora catharanthi]|uniref:hypothetical protein n=1 Tax=Microbispora catharanthi TaxID=1712871 RepID=UPI001F1045B5|nr:hypothetical protein [Microbispora catharanthi]